nr:MAG TPA: hypothetical protein [Caudoviricetes sp.]
MLGSLFFSLSKPLLFKILLLNRFFDFKDPFCYNFFAHIL